jgi:hypothetical protein
MPTLAEMYPAYGIRGGSSLGAGSQQGLGGSAFGGLPMGALAALVAQRGGGEQPPPNSTLAGAPPPGSPPPTGGSDLDRAMQAISAIESGSRGGNYGLMGPVTRTGDRAYGRYQVMGANVGPWTRQHLGRSLTPQEFLADQAAQDAVFRGQFGSYLSRYGNPSDAASMWFTGRPYSVGQTRSDAIPGVHPGLTGAQYVSRFLAGY